MQHSISVCYVVSCLLFLRWYREALQSFNFGPNFNTLVFGSLYLNKDRKRYLQSKFSHTPHVFSFVWHMVSGRWSVMFPACLSKYAFSLENCQFNMKSPQQPAHNRANEACMCSTQCMLSTNTPLTIIDWFVVELDGNVLVTFCKNAHLGPKTDPFDLHIQSSTNQSTCMHHSAMACVCSHYNSMVPCHLMRVLVLVKVA
jgi:hypothetical protein